MLQYLSGIKMPNFKAKAPAPAKNSQARPVALVKSLVKNIKAAPNAKAAAPARAVLKAAVKMPSVKKAIANQSAIKTIAQRSPLTAFRIQKAQVQKAIQTQQSKPIEAAPVAERYRNPAPVPTSIPEITQELIDEAETEDFSDFVDSEYPEDLEEQFEETGDFEQDESLGALKLAQKIAAKRQEKKAQKVQQKAVKTANKPKVIKAKAKAEAKVAKAQNPNRGKVLEKLIDTGSKLIDGKMNKQGYEETSLSPEAPEAKPGFFESIPKPVLYGAVAAAAFFGYKALKPAN